MWNHFNDFRASNDFVTLCLSELHITGPTYFQVPINDRTCTMNKKIKRYRTCTSVVKLDTLMIFFVFFFKKKKTMHILSSYVLLSDICEIESASILC